MFYVIAGFISIIVALLSLFIVSLILGLGVITFWPLSNDDTWRRKSLRAKTIHTFLKLQSNPHEAVYIALTGFTVAAASLITIMFSYVVGLMIFGNGI